MIHADGDWIRYAYNELGKVETKSFGTGAMGTAFKSIEYQYDELGLLTKKDVTGETWSGWTGSSSYTTADETFTYDALYRLTNAEDDDTKVELGWNSLDQLTSESLEVKIHTGDWTAKKTTTSTWDDTGKRRESLEYPVSARMYEFGHDALDRVVEIVYDDWSTEKPMCRYDFEGPGGRVLECERALDLDTTTASEKKLRTKLAYDALKRNTSIDHDEMTYLSGIGWVATNQFEFSYTWGSGANATTERLFNRKTMVVKNASGTTLQDHSYTYDTLSRLTQDKRNETGGPTYDFTLSQAQFLDLVKKDGSNLRDFKPTGGTSSLQMSSYDVSGASTSCSYDDAGNLTSELYAGNGTEYWYDHENRLVRVAGTGSGPSVAFRYDALGRRVAERKDTESDEQVFLYDGAHIIEEADAVDAGSSASLTQTRHTLIGNRIDEVVYMLEGTTTNLWPLTDHLGSTWRVFEQASNSFTEVTTINYETAYGEATVSGTNDDYPYGYTGRRRILGENGGSTHDLGLYDYRTRAYSPKLGRFLQRDSIGVWGNPAESNNSTSRLLSVPQRKPRRTHRWQF